MPFCKSTCFSYQLQGGTVKVIFYIPLKISEHSVKINTEIA